MKVQQFRDFQNPGTAWKTHVGISAPARTLHPTCTASQSKIFHLHNDSKTKAENKGHHRTGLVTSKHLSHPSVLRRTCQEQPVKQRGKPKSLDRRRNPQRCKELEQRASHIHVHTSPPPSPNIHTPLPPRLLSDSQKLRMGLKSAMWGPNELSVNLAGQIPSDDLRLAVLFW